jgi:hypothetical protein
MNTLTNQSTNQPTKTSQPTKHTKPSNRPTDPTEHCPWEANSPSASQEIPPILRNWKHTNYPFRKPEQSSHTFPSYFSIYFNTILPLTPRSSKWLFPTGFRTKTLCAFPLSHVPHIPPISRPWFDHPTDAWWKVQLMKFHITQFSPSFCFFIRLIFSQSYSRT